MRKLAELARREERRVCEEMGHAQRQLDERIRRLGELKSYRRDYGGRFPPGGQVSPARWQDYQHFLQRIDQAVAEQQQHIRTGRDLCDAHRRRWLARRQKLDSLERVVERFQKDENDTAERRQQNLLDEFALTRRQGHRGGGD